MVVLQNEKVLWRCENEQWLRQSPIQGNGNNGIRMNAEFVVLLIYLLSPFIYLFFLLALSLI